MIARLLAVGLAAVVLLGSMGSQAQLQITEPVPTNPIRREPVLVYDVSGTTLLGFDHYRLSVYNDGLITVSKKIPLTLVPVDPSLFEVNAHAKVISESEVEQLRVDLINAGAATLSDDTTTVFDIPLTTVTFFETPGPRAKSNTFSYWLAGGPFAAVESVVDAFIEFHFGNFLD